MHVSADTIYSDYLAWLRSATLFYKLELAEKTRVSDSRVSFLVSVLPLYNQAFPEPEVYIVPNVSEDEDE